MKGYGLLLPHFGEFATRENLLRGARLAERYGFDSVWVRDHLVFHPHGMEGTDRTHIEPMVTLALIAGATERLVLGTGSLIPYRHPIHAALCLASLEHVTGPGRVIAGFGIGTFDHEFAAIGLGDAKRGELMREQIDIMRRLWTGDTISFKGDFYSFSDIDIHPSPSAPIPVWYCGNSLLSVRRAIEYCDGWMPGRITLKTFRKRVQRLTRLAGEAGRQGRPATGAIPITSIGATREAALSKVNWSGMMEQAIKSEWESESGRFETADDLEGALIAGPPSEIAAAADRYHAAGLDHLVFDLRFRFDEWLEGVQRLGEDVLPLLRGRPLAEPSGAAARA